MSFIWFFPSLILLLYDDSLTYNIVIITKIKYLNFWQNIPATPWKIYANVIKPSGVFGVNDWEVYSYSRTSVGLLAIEMTEDGDIVIAWWQYTNNYLMVKIYKCKQKSLIFYYFEIKFFLLLRNIYLSQYFF